MRLLDTIIIHCSDTYESMDIGVKEIRQWHIDRGFNDIGYHYVIRRNGVLEEGRPLRIVGAHAIRHNFGSIGICLVGGKPEANFTAEQWVALDTLVATLIKDYDIDKVIGHRDVDLHGKTCPNFNVKAHYAGVIT